MAPHDTTPAPVASLAVATGRAAALLALVQSLRHELAGLAQRADGALLGLPLIAEDAATIQQQAGRLLDELETLAGMPPLFERRAGLDRRTLADRRHPDLET